MARSEVFRGYRSLTVGLSGVLGLVAAASQTTWVESPETDLGRYLALWVGVAVLNAAITGTELCLRAKAAGAGLNRDLTRLAVEQFLPCLLVGALLTACIYIHARKSLGCSPDSGPSFTALGSLRLGGS